MSPKRQNANPCNSHACYILSSFPQPIKPINSNVMNRKQSKQRTNNSSKMSNFFSKQPNIRKQQKHSKEESHPDFPTDTCPFCHAQHSVHGSSETDAGAVEGFVHGICLFHLLDCVVLYVGTAICRMEDKYQVG